MLVFVLGEQLGLRHPRILAARSRARQGKPRSQDWTLESSNVADSFQLRLKVIVTVEAGRSRKRVEEVRVPSSRGWQVGRGPFTLYHFQGASPVNFDRGVRSFGNSGYNEPRWPSNGRIAKLLHYWKATGITNAYGILHAPRTGTPSLVRRHKSPC